MSNVVSEYEVFKNGRDALALFFYRQEALDRNPPDGPFWFSVGDGAIVAGTAEHHAVFEGVKPELLDIARKRGVIMLMEFENQQPVRCTPCYIAKAL